MSDSEAAEWLPRGGGGGGGGDGSTSYWSLSHAGSWTMQAHAQREACLTHPSHEPCTLARQSDKDIELV